MSAIRELIVTADPREVQQVLRSGLSHIELVNEDVFEAGEDYIAVLIYQQYFLRAGNRAALVLCVSGRGEETRVKAVATGSSRDLLLDFDLWAAHDFADEPIRLLKEKFEVREV